MTMKRMTTLKDHERRITGLEDRVGEIETGFGETIYKIHRRLAKLELALFKHFKFPQVFPQVSEKEVDELLIRSDPSPPASLANLPGATNRSTPG